MRILKFAFALGLVVWLLKKGQINLHDLQALAHPMIATGLLSLVALNLALANWRWMVLLRTRDFDASFLTTFPLTLIGLFFSYALPGSVGGDVIKAFYVAKENPERKMAAVTTVLADRVIGLYCMLCMAVASVFMDVDLILQNRNLKVLACVLIGAFVMISVGLMAVFSKRVQNWTQLERRLPRMPMGHKLYRAYHSFHLYTHNRLGLLKAFLLSLVSQVIAILFIYVVGHILGETIGFKTYLFAVPIGFMISAIPISPAGIGVGQMAFAYLFRAHSGVVSNVGETAITAYQITLFIWSLVGCAFYLLRKSPHLTPAQAK